EADQGFRIGVESFGNGVTNDYEYYSLLNQPADCGADGTNACEPGALRSILTRDGSSQRNYLEYEYNRRGQVSSRVTGYDVGSQIDALQESFTYDVHDQLRTYTKTTWAFGGPVQQTEHQYVISGGGNIQEVYIDDQLTDEYTYSNARLS